MLCDNANVDADNHADDYTKHNTIIVANHLVHCSPVRAPAPTPSAPAGDAIAKLRDTAETLEGNETIDMDEFITLLQMDPTDQLDAYEWRVKANESETARLEQAAVEAER